jgi:hypothetical protein
MQEESLVKSQKEIVIAYQEAHNAHDIDGALSYFSPKIRFGMTGLWVREGLEEVRELEEWDAVMSSQLGLINFKMRNQRLECSGTETNDWFAIVGIKQIRYEPIKFEFEGDKIRHIRAQIAPKDEMMVDRAVNEVVRWALDIYPNEIHDLVPRGVFKYGHKHALRWKKLLEDWKQAT